MGWTSIPRAPARCTDCSRHRVDQLEAGTWAWTNETLRPKANERLALRNLPYGLGVDTRLYGRMRFVPAIKSFVLSDSPKLPAQALRPSAFV